MKSIAKIEAGFTIFKFDDKEVRVVIRDGEPWFIAADLCDALNLSNSRVSLMALDEEEKGVSSVYTLGGEQTMSIVSESGMYTLILRCRDAVKPGTTAYRVRKWVTNEVLPSIRKTGSYQQQVPVRRQAPKYRYTISMTVRDSVTGQTETFKGGANTPDEIINGTARNFGMHIFDMVAVPFVAY
jgi:prophage antirepressor-like protein